MTAGVVGGRKVVFFGTRNFRKEGKGGGVRGGGGRGRASVVVVWVVVGEVGGKVCFF